MNPALDSNASISFVCHLCGECCSSWNIPIEGEKARALLQKPWVQQRLAQTRRTLQPLDNDLYRIPLTDENECVFLAPDRACMVERYEGLALKPHECRRFPFARVNMPDGSVSCEASAACKSISEKLLLAFRPIVPGTVPGNIPGDAPRMGLPDQAVEGLDLTEPEPLPDCLPDFPDCVPVGWRQTPLTQEAYTQWQQQLSGWFTAPDVSPEAAMAQALYQMQGGAGTVPPARIAQLQGRWGSGFSRWLIRAFLRKPYGSWSRFQLLRGWGYHDPRVFGVVVHPAQTEAIPWDKVQNRLLNAFLFQLLQRKRLLCTGASLQSLWAMAAMACLLVRWYAQALAWLQQASTVSQQDVATAIRLVERYYTGHQPRFMALFQSRWQSGLLQAWFMGVG